jgi:hypothetical protein
MTTVKHRTLDLSRLRLAKSSHQPADLSDEQIAANGDAACLLEAVAYVAGEKWTDEPQCVSPVLGVFGRNLNDILPDDRRQELVPLIPKLLGTRDEQDEARSYLALDWLIRVYTPTWLRMVPALVSDADAIAGMPRIVDLESAAAVGDLVRDAAAHSRAAWAAAWAAAGDAAWAAARDAARAAARDAARAAARDAAGDAAWAAAGAAARDAARAAAGDAAGDAAWAAAGAAARAAAWAAARAAAWAAARDALAPTVAELQTSAIALFSTMIDPASAA